MPWQRPVVTWLLTAVMLASVGGLLVEQPMGKHGRSAAGSGHPSLDGNDAGPAR